MSTKISDGTHEIEIEFLGSPKKPELTDVVAVNYTGSLMDVTVFDQNNDRKNPLVIPVNRVIKGWQMTLANMVPGQRVKVTIPPELGYGNNAVSKIPANSTLVFEIELLAIL